MSPAPPARLHIEEKFIGNVLAIFIRDCTKMDEFHMQRELYWRSTTTM